MKLRASVAIVLGLRWSLVSVRAQDTACKGTTLDWYTSVVGETPCQTYQRLRQICNGSYTVGALRTATPGDNCDDQLADCCCNSISFALSMLCLNCQQGVGSGVNGDTGIDAGNGAYQMYLDKGNGNLCSPNVNQSFPTDIQSAVCNENIKIEDDLYTLFWTTGAWFYMYTRDTISKDHITYNNNTFTHCQSTTSQSSAIIQSSAATAAASSTSNSPVVDTAASSSAGSSVTSGSSTTSTQSQSHSISLSQSSSTHGGGANVVSSAASSSPSASAAGSGNTPNAASVDSQTHSSSLHVGTIVGIIAGVVALLLLFGLFWCLRRRGRSFSSQEMKAASTVEPFSSLAMVAAPEPHPAPANSSNNSNNNNVYTSGKQRQMSYHSTGGPVSRSIRSASSRHPPSTAASTSRARSESESEADNTPAAMDMMASDSDVSLLQERHIDGGVVLQRANSGRLPPAYGEQFN